MSAKSLVKSAREALEREEYSAALRLCDLALAEHPDTTAHYTALVFKAVALQHLEQWTDALSTFKEAHSLIPDNTLAWQGMVNLYGKAKDKGADLPPSGIIEPLEKLQRLVKDADKHLEITMKLIDAYESNGQKELCAQQIERLLAAPKESSLDIVHLLDRLIKVRLEIETERINKEVEVRRFRLGADPLPILRDKVTSEIVAASNLDQVILQRINMNTSDNLVDGDCVAVYVDRMMRKIPALKETKDASTRQLIAFMECHQSTSALCKRQLCDFTDWPNLETIPSSVDNETSFCYKLQAIRKYWLEGDLASSHKLLKQAQTHLGSLKASFGLSQPNLHLTLRRLEGLILSQDGRHQEAITLLNEIPEDAKVLSALIKCHQALGNYSVCIAIYQRMTPSLQSQSEMAWCHHLIGENSKAESILEELVSGESSDLAIIHIRLGIVKWELAESNRRDPDVCFALFLKAARADPKCIDAFIYLGHYYGQIVGDSKKAEQCYLKALLLDPSNPIAGKAVTEIWLRRASTMDPNGDARTRHDLLQNIIQVLEPISRDNLRDAQLWLTLGCALSGVGKHLPAATAFQESLKGDHPNQQRCLLGMAESYRQLGRYAAATKAYDRLISITESCATAVLVTCHVGLALLEIATGHLDAALTRLVSLKADDDIVVLLLMQVRVEYARQLIIHGCTDEALVVIGDFLRHFRIMAKAPVTSYLWLSRLGGLLLGHPGIGDFDTIDGLIGEHLTRIIDDASLEDNDVWSTMLNVLPKMNDHCTGVAKITLASLLMIILESDEEEVLANAWSDLAAVLLTILILKDHNASDSQFDAAELLEVALDCSKQATDACGHLPWAWFNQAIVKIHLDRFDWAQHCLIESLHTHPTFKEAWIALAILYHRLGHPDLTTQCLERIKITSPASSSSAWLTEASLQPHLLNSPHDINSVVDKMLTQAANIAPASDYAIHQLALLSTLRTIQCHEDSPVLQGEDLILLRGAMLKTLKFTKSPLIADLLQVIDIDLDQHGQGQVSQEVDSLAAAIDAVEKDIFNPSNWSQLSFFISTMSPNILSLETTDGEGEDGADEQFLMLANWTRMRLSPELVQRLFFKEAAECILAVHGLDPSLIPDEIIQIAKWTALFFATPINQ